MASKEDFLRVGDLQRGAPESAMLAAAYKMGGGVMQVAVEHIGDIIHRMNDPNTWSWGGYEHVKEKVDKTLRWLTRGYGFLREFEENLANNAKFYGEDPGSFRSEVLRLLQSYADSHRSLPTYNYAHRLAQQAAVSLGELRIGDAVEALQALQYRLGSQAEWVAFAHEGLDEGRVPRDFRDMVMELIA